MKKMFIVALIVAFAAACGGKKPTPTPPTGGSDMGSAAGSDMPGSGSDAGGSAAPEGGGSGG